MFTFLVKEGERRVTVNKDGAWFGYVEDTTFVFDRETIDAVHESTLPRLLDMKWGFGYSHETSFLRVMPLDQTLWWEVVAVESDGVYQVMPRLGFKPKLVNLVPHEVVVEALLKALPVLDPEYLVVIRGKGVKIGDWWLKGYPSKKIKKVAYYDLLDLPTWFKLV